MKCPCCEGDTSERLFYHNGNIYFEDRKPMHIEPVVAKAFMHLYDNMGEFVAIHDKPGIRNTRIKEVRKFILDMKLPFMIIHGPKNSPRYCLIREDSLHVKAI